MTQAAAPMNQSHGSPYDRGRADSYYRRAFIPHYFVIADALHADIYPALGFSKKVTYKDMTSDEIIEYTQGFQDNEADLNFKEWC